MADDVVIEIENEDNKYGHLGITKDLIKRIETLENKVEIEKNIEAFFKVERITIIESRLDQLEALHKDIEPESEIQDEVPSESTIPPLPEPLTLITEKHIENNEVNEFFDPAGVITVTVDNLHNEDFNEVDIIGHIEKLPELDIDTWKTFLDSAPLELLKQIEAYAIEKQILMIKNEINGGENN